MLEQQQTRFDVTQQSDTDLDGYADNILITMNDQMKQTSTDDDDG